MNVSGINLESIADGDGVWVAVHISSCLHNCKGCHNPTSHSPTAGRPFTGELQREVIEYIKETPSISGLILSGGDSMYSASEFMPSVTALKEDIKDISVWIYSGLSYERILENSEMLSLLSLCDVFVDGEFILKQRDMTPCYKRSSNQRIIDIPKSFSSEETILWKSEIVAVEQNCKV